MGKYETEEQREEYATRLCRKAWDVIHREAPTEGKEEVSWKAITPLDSKAMRAISDFTKGRISKEEVDAAVLAVVGAWRREFAAGRKLPSIGSLE